MQIREEIFLTSALKQVLNFDGSAIKISYVLQISTSISFI